MKVSTTSKRRLAATALAAGALAVVAPVAQASSGFQGSPDAFERAAAAGAQLEQSFQGSPDAFERAAAAQPAQSSFQGSPDGIDRARDAGLTVSTPPDAFERGLITRANERSVAIGVPTTESPVVNAEGFDWSVFSLGAGVGIGSALLLAALGLGVVTGRRGQRVSTA